MKSVKFHQVLKRPKGQLRRFELQKPVKLSSTHSRCPSACLQLKPDVKSHVRHLAKFGETYELWLQTGCGEKCAIQYKKYGGIWQNLTQAIIHLVSLQNASRFFSGAPVKICHILAIFFTALAKIFHNPSVVSNGDLSSKCA